MPAATKFALCLVGLFFVAAPPASAGDYLIEIEWIDMPKGEAQKLLFDRKFTHDMTPLRREVQALIDSGKATVSESSILTTTGGLRVEGRSLAEKVYPVEYFPSKWVTEIPAPLPITFEFRNTGFYTIALVKETSSGKLRCDLHAESVRVNGQIDQTTTTSSTGKKVLLHPYLVLSHPIFATQQFSTTINATPGAYHLVAQLTPPGIPTHSRLSFIRVSPIPRLPKEKP